MRGNVRFIFAKHQRGIRGLVYLRSSMGSFEMNQTGRSASAIFQRLTAGSWRAVETNDRVDRSLLFSFLFHFFFFSSSFSSSSFHSMNSPNALFCPSIAIKFDYIRVNQTVLKDIFYTIIKKYLLNKKKYLLTNHENYLCSLFRHLWPDSLRFSLLLVNIPAGNIPADH